MRNVFSSSRHLKTCHSHIFYGGYSSECNLAGGSVSPRVSFEVKNLTPLLVQSVRFMLVVQDVSPQLLSQVAMPSTVMDSYLFGTIRWKNLLFVIVFYGSKRKVIP